MRRSAGEGWALRWKDRVMATETTAMYTASRRYDRKVRSLAQWSRASLLSFAKSSGPGSGRVQNVVVDSMSPSADVASELYSLG